MTLVEKIRRYRNGRGLGQPLTAGYVAAKWSVSRNAAYMALRQLFDRGELLKYNNPVRTGSRGPKALEVYL